MNLVNSEWYGEQDREWGTASWWLNYFKNREREFANDCRKIEEKKERGMILNKTDTEESCRENSGMGHRMKEEEGE